MADMKKSSNKRFGLGDIIIFGIILIMIIVLFIVEYMDMTIYL